SAAAEIIEAIWDKKNPEGGYEFASSYYKGQVSHEQFVQTMQSPEIEKIEITSRRLVDISLVKGVSAVPGGKNVHVLYRVELEGQDLTFNENLFLMEEDGKWLMTGHWVQP
ncbi:MAG: DUF4019 domain-containing protein, partial [Verrucomicrobiota bacterium]